MAIPLTLGDCLAAEEALTRLAAQPTSPKIAYRLAKLLRLIRVETAHFHEQRIALFKELATPEELEAGVMNGHAAAFTARINELCAVPVELVITPLTSADIDALQTVRADDLMRLGPCLEEPS
jgi:hypothetical protein